MFTKHRGGGVCSLVKSLYRVKQNHDLLLSDVFAFHGDGHNDTKMGPNIDPLAQTCSQYYPSESNAGQGGLKWM